MVHVMRDPRRQKLTQGDPAERRVLARPLEVDFPQLQCRQLLEALCPQLGESVEQLVQRLSPRMLELGEPVEGLEGLALAVGEQVLDPRHPVGPLTMDQVTEYVVRTPRLRAFVALDPRVGQVAQQYIEDARGAREDRDRMIE